MKKNNNSNLQQFIALVVLVLLGIGSTHYVVSKIPEKVTKNILEIEYNKVWWKENYEKINEIQKKQIVDGLKQYEAQNGQVKAPQAQQAPAPTNNKISLEQAKKVTNENTYILGNPDAEITWVEYSDLECPFCKKLHQAWTIEEVMKAYDWKVNFVFKQFPLGFHKQAQMEAEALLCAGDLEWKDKYYEFISKIFDGSRTNGNSYSKETISELWGTIWIDKDKLLSCIESGKFNQQAKDEMAEWSNLFGITGTPGNVLINNKTGKWDKLPGAYPTASFKQKIDSLLSK